MIHVPYGCAVVPSPSRSRGDSAGKAIEAAAAPLASGASRAACYAFKGAAGPGRIDPPPLGPINGSYSRSA